MYQLVPVADDSAFTRSRFRHTHLWDCGNNCRGYWADRGRLAVWSDHIRQVIVPGAGAEIDIDFMFPGYVGDTKYRIQAVIAAEARGAGRYTFNLLAQTSNPGDLNQSEQVGIPVSLDGEPVPREIHPVRGRGQGMLRLSYPQNADAERVDMIEIRSGWLTVENNPELDATPRVLRLTFQFPAEATQNWAWLYLQGLYVVGLGA